jgi:NAD(P)-dependent dehydrogenase (short-subunit alcohol dehydrogenase family)
VCHTWQSQARSNRANPYGFPTDSLDIRLHSTTNPHPNDYNVLIVTGGKCFEFSNKNFITFRNLIFRHWSGGQISSCRGFVMDGCELNQMVAQGGGAIVNTASIAGLIGLPTSSAYVAAKHGVVGLTKTAALEYADDKIRVNAVCPGYIETKMTEDTMRRRGAELMAKVPFHRLGKPEEIAQMVVWLCSDRASYVSGAAYNVDGGYMAT